MRRILILCLFLIGCGYQLVGTSSNKEGIHLAGSTIYIKPFQNRTGEPNVEYWITQELISSIQRAGKITVTSKEKAQYILEGEVTRYAKEIVALDSSGDVSTYRLNVSVNIRIYTQDGKMLKEIKGIQEYEDYRVYDEIERTKTEERKALGKIAREIGQQIASLLL